MKDLVSFTADSANEAIDKVRDELGPDAIIEKVVKLPAKGVNRIWQKPKIQVFAKPGSKSSKTKPKAKTVAQPELQASDSSQDTTPWAISEMLQASGLLPQYAMEILEKVQKKSGSREVSLSQQKQLTILALEDSWKRFVPHQSNSGSTHLFIGPSAVGKSTSLCKWMTHHMLINHGSARAFQINNERAHVNSELLSVHCEILGISLESVMPDISAPQSANEHWFVDLPGTDFYNKQSMNNLRQVISEFQNPQVHLVLNLAYETPIFLGQLMSCIKAKLPISSLIITHLDDEMRWGKIWNLVFASGIPISNFSTGQNIPGDFLKADVDLVLRQQFPS